jgi:MFS family permease
MSAPAEPLRAADRVLTPRFVLVVAVGLAYFTSLGLLLPTVPQYVEQELDGGDVAVGLSVGAFALGAVLLRPFAGRIGDRWGRRVLIVGGALVVGVSALLYHVVPAVAAFVPARIIGGIGEAAFFVGAGTMVTDLAPEARRGEAISYWSVAVYGGLAFGPFAGEAILDRSGFGAVWNVAAVLAIGASLLALLTRETVDTGAARTTSGRTHLLHRAALGPGLVLFLGMLALAGFFGFVPLYVDEIGVADSGRVFLLYGCVVLAVRILGARLPDQIGAVRAGLGATAGVAAGMAIVAGVPEPWGLYAGTVVFALGMSLLYPAMLMLALAGLPETERASAVGTVSSFFDLSQGIGAVLLGTVAELTGYRGAFLVGGALALAGLALLRSPVTAARTAAPAPAPPDILEI